MTTALRPVVGLITIGQSPRVDVVPEMTAVIGPGVDVREAGALDGLTRAQIDALEPTGDDEILVTRRRHPHRPALHRRLSPAALEPPAAAAPAPAVRRAPSDAVARPPGRRDTL